MRTLIAVTLLYAGIFVMAPEQSHDPMPTPFPLLEPSITLASDESVKALQRKVENLEKKVGELENLHAYELQRSRAQDCTEHGASVIFIVGPEVICDPDLKPEVKLPDGFWHTVKP